MLVGRSFFGIHKTTQGRMNNWITDKIDESKTNNRIEGKTRNRIRDRIRGKTKDRIKGKIRGRIRSKTTEIAIDNHFPQLN